MSYNSFAARWRCFETWEQWNNGFRHRNFIILTWITPKKFYHPVGYRIHQTFSFIIGHRITVTIRVEKTLPTVFNQVFFQRLMKNVAIIIIWFLNLKSKHHIPLMWSEDQYRQPIWLWIPLSTRNWHHFHTVKRLFSTVLSIELVCCIGRKKNTSAFCVFISNEFTTISKMTK